LHWKGISSLPDIIWPKYGSCCKLVGTTTDITKRTWSEVKSYIGNQRSVVAQYCWSWIFSGNQRNQEAQVKCSESQLLQCLIEFVFLASENNVQYLELPVEEIMVLGKPRQRWENNIKVDLKKKEFQGVGLDSWVGSTGGLLWIWDWTFGFHRKWKNSWLMAHQEGLYSMDLVKWIVNLVIKFQMIWPTYIFHHSLNI
jgi:hypothetical protein